VAVPLFVPRSTAKRTAPDYGLALGSTALILADWSQTLQIIREAHTRHEGNPLLGRHPSEGRVNTMIGLAVTTNLAALLLPKRPRRIWYAAVTLIEGIAVTHNLANGLSIGF
jgi:hypothetical protein